MPRLGDDFNPLFEQLAVHKVELSKSWIVDIDESSSLDG